MGHLFLAIDQGTTGTKVLAVDETLTVLAEGYAPFPQHYPQPGWVEHDPDEIWASVLLALDLVLQKIPGRKIDAIGITNQRETLCFWNKKTGQKLSPAIVWQDRRTADFCQKLKSQGMENLFQDKTGLLLDPYFSGTKAAWAIQNWPEVKKASQEGVLALGTIDSYLIARLTGFSSHVTEPSNACRTLVFNIKNKTWDPELCKILDIPLSVLPEVKASGDHFGITRSVPGLLDGVPITGVLGDQQSALLGQACVHEGMAKCTFGTGAFLLMNTGSKMIKSQHRLLTSIAWSFKSADKNTDQNTDQKTDQNSTYMLEGSAFIAGAAIQWLRDGLQIIHQSSEVEALAQEVPDTMGLTFVPALTGLGAPYWDPHARGLFTGITRGTTRAHFARAALEGIAFQNTDILHAMEKDLGRKLNSLNVDGGASANNLLMQIQSDFLGVQLKRPKILETTSMGAVFAAGLGIGHWKDFSEIERVWKSDREFKPLTSDSDRTRELSRWHQAVKLSLQNNSN